MSEMEVIQEAPLTLAELKEKIGSIEKKVKELNFRTNKTSEYLKLFVKEKADHVLKIKKALQELDILRLKEKQITKVIDLMPADVEQVRLLLAGENITLKPEELQKILTCLNHT